jgi:fructokinase
MKQHNEISIFGEVLFDCFPTGDQILGGAPFNVAWHLQALGDRPRFISRVGKDLHGEQIIKAMGNWGMDTTTLQSDSEHPTGRVEVMINSDQPSYDIVADSAYDYIQPDQQISASVADSILYHGTLCLRNRTSRTTFDHITRDKSLRIFLDVNLRSPWWQRDQVYGWLEKAHWAKMNVDELTLLSDSRTNLHQQMAELQTSCSLEQLIVTQGEQGAVIRTSAGTFHSLLPEKIDEVVDYVGAGDAFSAVYIHGLRNCWPTDVTLHHAQKFAGKVIGLRGATTTDRSFYQECIASYSKVAADQECSER